MKEHRCKFKIDKITYSKSMVQNNALGYLKYDLNLILKGTVIQIEKARKNDRLRVSKVFWKFYISTIYISAVIYPWSLLFS